MLGPQRFGGEERFESSVVDADGPGAGPEEHAGGGGFPAARSVVLRCCHVTQPLAWLVSAPRADDPDRRTPSACDTSLRRASSWEACRARPLRQGARAFSPAQFS